MRIELLSGSSGFRSSGSGSTSGISSGITSGSSSFRSGTNGFTGSVRSSGSGIASGVSSFRSSSFNFFSSFFSLVRASRESENASGGSCSENDLAHEWYSLNSEWTTHGTQPHGKPTLEVDFARQLVVLAQLCKH